MINYCELIIIIIIKLYFIYFVKINKKNLRVFLVYLLLKLICSRIKLNIKIQHLLIEEWIS